MIDKVQAKLKVMADLDKNPPKTNNAEEIAEGFRGCPELRDIPQSEIVRFVEFWLWWGVLQSMTPEQQEAYRRESTEQLTRELSEENPLLALKLQSLKARCDGIAKKIKNPLVRAEMTNRLMFEDGLNRLDGVLNYGEGVKVKKFLKDTREYLK